MSVLLLIMPVSIHIYRIPFDLEVIAYMSQMTTIMTFSVMLPFLQLVFTAVGVSFDERNFPFFPLIAAMTLDCNDNELCW